MTYLEILKELTEFDFDFYLLVEYQGMDPQKVLDALIKAAVKAKKTLKEFTQDMIKVVTFYVRRGTSFKRNDFGARSKQGAEKDVNALMSTYGIMQNLAGDFSPDRISVARVIILFAETAAAIYNSGMARPIVVPEGALPMCFAFPSSPALMNDTEWALWKEDYLNTMVKFTKIINRPGAGANRANANNNNNNNATPTVVMTDDVIKSTQLNYAEVARNSAFAQATRTQRRAKFNDLSKLFTVIAESDDAKKANVVPNPKPFTF